MAEGGYSLLNDILLVDECACLLFRLYISLSVGQYIYQCVSLSGLVLVHLYVGQTDCYSVILSVYLSVYQSVYLFCLSFCLSVCLTVSLLVRLLFSLYIIQ